VPSLWRIWFQIRHHLGKSRPNGCVPRFRGTAWRTLDRQFRAPDKWRRLGKFFRPDKSFVYTIWAFQPLVRPRIKFKMSGIGHMDFSPRRRSSGGTAEHADQSGPPGCSGGAAIGHGAQRSDPVRNPDCREEGEHPGGNFYNINNNKGKQEYECNN